MPKIPTQKPLRLFLLRLVSKGLLFWIVLALIFHTILIFYFFKTQNNKKIPYLQKSADIIFIDKKKQTDPHAKQVVEVPKNSAALKKPLKADFLANEDSYTKKQTVLKNASLNKSRQKAPAAKKPHDPLGLYEITDDTLGKSATKFGDYAKDIQEGDETRLNAWQWQHATFFNRMKEKVASAWSPQRKIEQNDPQGKIIGKQDLLTVVAISMDRQGNLTNINVIGSSQIAFLDDEAINAFKKSAPFLYPPKELFTNGADFAFQFSFYVRFDKGLSIDFNW